MSSGLSPSDVASRLGLSESAAVVHQPENIVENQAIAPTNEDQIIHDESA